MGRFHRQGLRAIIIKELFEIVVLQDSYRIWKVEEKTVLSELRASLRGWKMVGLGRKQ